MKGVKDLILDESPKNVKKLTNDEFKEMKNSDS